MTTTKFTIQVYGPAQYAVGEEYVDEDGRVQFIEYDILSTSVGARRWVEIAIENEATQAA